MTCGRARACSRLRCATGGAHCAHQLCAADCGHAAVQRRARTSRGRKSLQKDGAEGLAPAVCDGASVAWLARRHKVNTYCVRHAPLRSTLLRRVFALGYALILRACARWLAVGPPRLLRLARSVACRDAPSAALQSAHNRWTRALWTTTVVHESTKWTRCRCFRPRADGARPQQPPRVPTVWPSRRRAVGSAVQRARGVCSVLLRRLRASVDQRTRCARESTRHAHAEPRAAGLPAGSALLLSAAFGGCSTLPIKLLRWRCTPCPRPLA